MSRNQFFYKIPNSRTINFQKSQIWLNSNKKNTPPKFQCFVKNGLFRYVMRVNPWTRCRGETYQGHPLPHAAKPERTGLQPLQHCCPPAARDASAGLHQDQGCVGRRRRRASLPVESASPSESASSLAHGFGLRERHAPLAGPAKQPAMSNSNWRERCPCAIGQCLMTHG